MRSSTKSTSADLPPVAVDGDGAMMQGGLGEVGEPALIGVAALVRAVDAAHAEDDVGQAEGPGVVEDVLVGRALAAAVGAVEVERRLADAVADGRVLGRGVAVAVDAEAQARQVAVHLVGGGVQQRRGVGLAALGLEDVERAERVDLEVVPGVDERGGDGDLGGEVVDGGRTVHGVVHGGGVSDVGAAELDVIGVLVPQPAGVARDAGAGEVVEDEDAAALPGEAVGEVGADEARPAEDQDVARVAVAVQGFTVRRRCTIFHTANPRCRSSA